MHAPPPKQRDKDALSEKKRGRMKVVSGERGGQLCDNGFHQIPPLSQIKMPAWRALAIFLFICARPLHTHARTHTHTFRMASAIGFGGGQSIVTRLPHIQGEVNLNLIGDCLILPIADSCSWYRSQSCSSHISSHRAV